ncbi:antibiotic biosynthesis monooxygenase [Kocuria sp. M1R5S2]|uniref:antibiotic biosynthesis monooxygenase n=1 Tax=Kocuria rhizosphaerae TaxID=3376285 RepID=UPI0037ADB359
MNAQAHVLTEVSARVSPERETELLNGYRALAAQPYPDGLLRSELLRAGDGRWRVQTLWRDQAALDAMRARPEPPAAPRLFRSVGAEPSLVVWQVAVSLDPTATAEA